ncbi:hypothetical protein BS467_12775 [Bacillus altitudinis]|nr:hypothetical protein BS467_12775 [Bacillus altitudinis]
MVEVKPRRHCLFGFLKPIFGKIPHDDYVTHGVIRFSSQLAWILVRLRSKYVMISVWLNDKRIKWLKE